MQPSSFLALDVGDKRIGVALASAQTRLPHPLTTLDNNEHIMSHLRALITEHQVVAMVVGLPRGLDGQHTAQTRVVELFGQELKKHIDLPFYWQDEAGTSRLAEEELTARGKSFDKRDIDALAATYILDDFLQTNPGLAT